MTNQLCTSFFCRVAEANLLLVVIDAAVVNPREHVEQVLAECDADGSVPVLVVVNKADKLKKHVVYNLPWQTVSVSCLENIGIGSLVSLRTF